MVGRIAICWALLASGVLLWCSGCSAPKKYTVIDHRGNVHEHMTPVDGGWGWTEFEGPDGKTMVVRGEYSYAEE